MRSRCGVALAALVATLGMVAAQANAGVGGLHGISIAKGCSGPICDGEATDCIIGFGYNDDFGDTIRVLEAWDVVDFGGDNVRVPDIGNLPIVVAGGNTTCTVGGALPCEIGPGGSTLSGLPGDPDPGFVRFQQNTYIVQPDDAASLADQATVIWEDLCDDPGTSGCGSGILNQAPAPASTPVARCDDGDACTDDSCEAGVCSNEPKDCDDGDACTVDICFEGICVHTVIPCDDGDQCTSDACVDGVCVFTPDFDCDDGDACTDDTCDPATGSCVNTPNYDCDDGDACTEDRCDSATGACVHSDPTNCDDGDACTDDICDPDTGSCVNTPNFDCDDGDACTVDSCDSATGACVFEPNPKIDCDDGDDCTADRCVPETGDCENVEIDPPPTGCGDFAGCTPGFWKQPHHVQYWVDYAPGDSFETTFGVDAIILDGKTLREAMWTGGGGEAALGRHAVAALLNSSNGEVAYGFSTDEVIAMVQEAYATGDFQHAKGILAEQNELGCTVDTSNKNPGRGGRSSRGGR